MTELAVLQGLRMKGRATKPTLAEVTGLSPAELNGVLEAAIDEGLVADREPTFRLTAAGRMRLNDLLTEERRRVDQAVLGKLYPAFTVVNDDLKNAIAAWQVRDGIPNEHTDESYDAAAAGRLITLAGEAMPVLGAITVVVPRLARYVVRLERARARIVAHEYGYIAAPTVDSFHQVWFELHEELINLLGLSRLAEDTIEP